MVEKWEIYKKWLWRKNNYFRGRFDFGKEKIPNK